MTEKIETDNGDRENKEEAVEQGLTVVKMELLLSTAQMWT